MNLIEEVKHMIDDTLGLRGRLEGMKPEDPLLGAVPELDSVGVVSILSALEDRFGLVVEDDEISADTFGSLSALAGYVDSKAPVPR
jgi:acyl carrier protein